MYSSSAGGWSRSRGTNPAAALFFTSGCSADLAAGMCTDHVFQPTLDPALIGHNRSCLLLPWQRDFNWNSEPNPSTLQRDRGSNPGDICLHCSYWKSRTSTESLVYFSTPCPQRATTTAMSQDMGFGSVRRPREVSPCPAVPSFSSSFSTSLCCPSRVALATLPYNHIILNHAAAITTANTTTTFCYHLLYFAFIYSPC